MTFPVLLTIVFSFWHTEAATVLTQTVGTSAYQVVTSREVKANDLIEMALAKEIRNQNVEISTDGPNRTLFEIAIFKEAQTLSAVKLEADELNTLVTAVKDRLQKNSDWKEIDPNENEIKTWVERKKTAHEFLKLKSSTLTSIVTEQEIQEYYDKNRVKFGSTPLADQKANIRLFLQKQSQQQRIKEWLGALKTKYQIKNDLTDIQSEGAAAASPPGAPISGSEKK